MGILRAENAEVAISCSLPIEQRTGSGGTKRHDPFLQSPDSFLDMFHLELGHGPSFKLEVMPYLEV
jgi:hypothetical protein